MGHRQVGKAQDFDSCIPLVRVQPSQPDRRELRSVRGDFFATRRPTSPLSALFSTQKKDDKTSPNLL